ncbi:MAG: hypothetical protein DRH30_00930 [Deltaproteobacteria bacterium]|nr:MAG: hypothetical protein DRH30_00930 [Deltaproteobacteria bacterium]
MPGVVARAVLSVGDTSGDIFLDDRQDARWAFQCGVQPYVGIFTGDEDAMEKIATTAGAVSLTLRGARKSITIKELFVIGEGPRRDPWSRTVIVADKRIFWNRIHVRKSFNIRRRSGDLRRETDDGPGKKQAPAQAQNVSQDIGFRETSLLNGKPYNAAEAVGAVLDSVVGKGNWSGDLSKFPQGEVDSMEIDDPGDVALRRVFALLPGADVWIDRNGGVIVKDAANTGDAEDEIEGLLFLEGSDIPAQVDLSQMRPQNVNVLFTPEQEIRLDFRENIRKGSSNFWVENVIQSPDEKITVAGKTILRGMWVEASALITAWQSEPGSQNLTESFIRMFWPSAELEKIVVLLGSMNPEVDWVGRLSALRAHYRRTYRIPKFWMDRFESFRAYRCSVRDPETGTFGSSPVWQDYAVKFSSKGAFFNVSKQGVAANVLGGVDIGKPLSGSKPAPGRLSVLDAELGIIQVQFLVDYAGNLGTIYPSAFVDELSTAPRVKFPVCADGTRDGRLGAVYSLRPKHRMSTIITAVPAAPNSAARLMAITIPSAMALSRLPARTRAKIGESKGINWSVRVAPQIATARYAWENGKAAAIKRVMGGTAAQDTEDSFDKLNHPSIAVVRTLLDGQLVNEIELLFFAESLAAGIYATMTDHTEGVFAVDMNPNLRPVGNIQAVTHTITGDGASITGIVMPQPRFMEDANALMPEGVRSLIQSKVQP